MYAGQKKPQHQPRITFEGMESANIAVFWELCAINEEPNPILADTPIRDVQGRFTDGTEEQQEEIEL